jgi:hypothetical protein
LLELQAVTDKRSGRWYSIDLLRTLLLGTTETSGILDEGYAAFITDNIEQLDALASEATWDENRNKLDKLAAARAKALFG